MEHLILRCVLKSNRRRLRPSSSCHSRP